MCCCSPDIIERTHESKRLHNGAFAPLKFSSCSARMHLWIRPFLCPYRETCLLFLCCLCRLFSFHRACRHRLRSSHHSRCQPRTCHDLMQLLPRCRLARYCLGPYAMRTNRPSPCLFSTSSSRRHLQNLSLEAEN